MARKRHDALLARHCDRLAASLLAPGSHAACHQRAHSNRRIGFRHGAGACCCEREEKALSRVPGATTRTGRTLERITGDKSLLERGDQPEALRPRHNPSPGDAGPPRSPSLGARQRCLHNTSTG
jgi:hypothetical protein